MARPSKHGRARLLSLAALAVAVALRGSAVGLAPQDDGPRVFAASAQRFVHRQEQFLDWNLALNEMLLVHVRYQGFEARPVGLDAERVGVAAEYFVEFVNILVQPGQHERMAALQPR